MTSKVDDQPPEPPMSQRAQNPDASPTALEAGALDDGILERLSALLDGALGPDDEGALLTQIDADPRLADALAELAMVRGAFAPAGSSIDVADRVMAAVDPRGLSSTAEGSTLGAMLLADGEATSAEVTVVASHDDAAHHFLLGVEAVHGHLTSSVERSAAQARPVAERVARALSDDERAIDLAFSLADGEGDADTFATLVALLEEEPHGARRVREVEDAVAARRSVAEHLRRPMPRVDAARIDTAVERAWSSTPARSAEPVSIFTRIARVAPAGIAIAALALFVLLGRVDDGREPSLEPDAPVDLIAAAPFDVLPDNTSTVEALETGGGSAVVFSTPASHITIIWVGGTDTAEQGT